MTDDESRTARLDEFVDNSPRADPPLLERFFEVPVPHDANTKGRAGWVVRHTRPGYGYISTRTRGRDVTTIAGCVHYHYKTGGYPISESVIRRLDMGVGRFHPERDAPVTSVYIAEEDTGDIYEYDLDQYLDGERVTTDEPQLSVPCDDAVCVWYDQWPDALVARGTIEGVDWEGDS